VACLAGFETGGYPDGDSTSCTWTITPSKPGSGPAFPRAGTSTTESRQAAEFASICAEGLAPRLCEAFPSLATLLLPFVAPDRPETVGTTAPKVTPRPSVGALSSFTCSWWRKADAAHRLGMVQRIRHFATMPIDGPTPYGYGAGMSDSRATQLFNNRCSVAQAGPFALYKLYGAAAPFSALVP
jgi:hypothetical protein